MATVYTQQTLRYATGVVDILNEVSNYVSNAGYAFATGDLQIENEDGVYLRFVERNGEWALDPRD